jgi:hypothetical protein
MFIKTDPYSSFSGRFSRLLGITLVIASGAVFFTSCEPEPRQARATDHIRMLDDTVINYHRQVVHTEQGEIDDYILRHQWQMLKTPTGLRFMIYRQGKGAVIRKGDLVEIKYSLSLLNGTEIYSSARQGNRFIRPGATEGETGLQEALLMMKCGDCAKLIAPSHLAFGLLGDLDKVPSSAALVYDLEVLTVKAEKR